MNKSKFIGAMLGVAVGDALGGPVEMCKAVDIAAKYGVLKDMVGGGWLDLQPGETTDDTEMTVIIADAIVKNPESPFIGISKGFVNMLLSYSKGMGSTCKEVIMQAYALAGGAEIPIELWLNVASAYYNKKPNKSSGNGALMRATYPALYYGANPREMDSKTRLIAKMTHCSEESTEACVLFTRIITDLAFAEYESSEQAKKEVICKHLLDTCYENLSEDIAPTGYVVNTFKCALQCVLQTETFEQAVIKAVNKGGDADTIAAIVGAMAGAMYGKYVIPQRWVDALDPNTVDKLEVLGEIAYLRSVYALDFGNNPTVSVE